MAWNPFNKDTPAAPAPSRRPADVPVVDGVVDVSRIQRVPGDDLPGAQAEGVASDLAGDGGVASDIAGDGGVASASAPGFSADAVDAAAARLHGADPRVGAAGGLSAAALMAAAADSEDDEAADALLARSHGDLPRSDQRSTELPQDEHPADEHLTDEHLSDEHQRDEDPDATQLMAPIDAAEPGDAFADAASVPFSAEAVDAAAGHLTGSATELVAAPPSDVVEDTVDDADQALPAQDVHAVAEEPAEEPIPDRDSPRSVPPAPVAAAFAVPAAAVAASVPVAAGAARASGDDGVSEEQARLERERAARREARLAALESVREDDPLQRPAAQAPLVRPARPVTDRFWGSLALFLLRLVTAAILFVHGMNGIINNAPVQTTWANTVLPFPRYIGLGLPWVEVGIALLLVFGVLTRLAGLATLGIMGLTLAFVMWGRWSIFEPGGTGFLGEHELLLAIVGLVLMLLGAGAWSIDYALRRGRREAV